MQLEYLDESFFALFCFSLLFPSYQWDAKTLVGVTEKDEPSEPYTRSLPFKVSRSANWR